MHRITFCLSIALLVLAACATAPYTGRRQLLLTTQGDEAKMGLQAYDEIKQKEPVSKNVAWTKMVENVGRRIAAVADQPDFQWEFRLIAADTVNAFCLPGGKVAFYEGIMPVCQDEAGVAVVMGHEVSHAIARHGGERISQNMVADNATQLLSDYFGGKSETSKALVHQGLALGIQYGGLLPFSRAHESEADHIGLILMAKAGYDPHTAPIFWERMMKASPDHPPEFLSTHPNPDTRISQLNGWMPEAMPYFTAAKPTK